MYIPFVAVLVGAHLLVAAPTSIPRVDIRKTCEAAAGEMTELMAGSTARHDLDECQNSEQAARAQLAKNWAAFSAVEKAQCVQPSVYLPSYIEWLTCLEMTL